MAAASATTTTPTPGRPAADQATAALRFCKMHGAGNDFVVLDLRGDADLARRLSDPVDGLARAISNRRTGVGCDQILGIEAPRSAGAVASYRIWNADGSPAQQCGNGARCVAAWLVRDGLGKSMFALDSPAGRHDVERVGAGLFSVAMGQPAFVPQAVPLSGFDSEQDAYEVEAEGARIRFGAASMGNPHAVIVVDDVERAPVAVLGPLLQAHAAFPQSVNVGFAQVVARDRIRLRVYERGAGETLACGSGACAAVAVLTRQGRVGGHGGVAVSLPGGELQIHYDRDTGSIRMTGPAAFVFDGEWTA